MWAVNPKVIKFLSLNRFKLTIVLDEKYRKCITDKPLIVITQEDDALDNLL